jgi:hypothetical protein
MEKERTAANEEKGDAAAIRGSKRRARFVTDARHAPLVEEFATRPAFKLFVRTMTSAIA